MATLTPTLTLVSTDATSDSLNLSATDSLSVLGRVTQKRIATSTTAAVFLAAADYSKSYVFLKNLSSTAAERIDIRATTGGTDIIQLGAGEWTFMPWAGSHDLAYDAADGTPVLEILVFQAAA
jgi:sarcosine oxidase gamma subunit